MNEQVPADDRLHPDEFGENLDSVHVRMESVIFSILKRALNQDFTYDLARLLHAKRMHISFGLDCATLKIEMLGSSQTDCVAVIELGLVQSENKEEEPLTLSVYCPLFREKNTSNLVPCVELDKTFYSTQDKVPAVKQRTLELLSEALDAIHNLHVGDTQKDEALVKENLEPVTDLLKAFNTYFRGSVQFERDQSQ